MLPKVRTETARKSFYFKGSKLFNDTVNSLLTDTSIRRTPLMKDLNSVMIFKTRILKFYRSQAFQLLLKLVAVFTVFRFFRFFSFL